jgi:hypothetical protein
MSALVERLQSDLRWRKKRVEDYKAQIEKEMLRHEAAMARLIDDLDTEQEAVVEHEDALRKLGAGTAAP